MLGLQQVKRIFSGLVFLAFTANAFGPEASFPDALESDPAALKWMVGSPPPEDKIIRFSDGGYFTFPALRWTVSNFRQLMPTVNVSRGLKSADSLQRQMNSAIDQLMFKPMNSDQPMT